MRGRVLLGAALCAASVAVAPGPWGPVRAQEGGEPEEPASAPPEISAKPVLQGLDRIIRKLRANDGALAINTPASKSKKAFPGAAVMATEYIVPLGGSFLDPSGTLQGSIRWTFDDEDLPSPRVDDIQVILLTGKIDRAALRSTLKAAGKATGLKFENDEEDPDTWFDVDAKKVDVWVAIGDGVVVLDASRAD